MRSITMAAASLLLAIAAGCGGGSKACDELKKKVCDGLDGAKCGAWFDGQMKEIKSDGGDVNTGCKLLLDDKDLLSGWKDLAKMGIAGEDKKKPADDKKADDKPPAEEKPPEDKPADDKKPE
ncbi:MAG: hypothetical protein KF773_14275 [Deltaproteobacteria bacterium]|nr:hypothetical protein [Deltaproteobacteria bacterium]MCW5805855.1 hypothetical protein [Deltaproteobacteria bacterium]